MRTWVTATRFRLLFDIEAISSMARSLGAWSVVDNAFATPILQRPLDLGADVVVHSLSKYVNGHSDVLMGAVILEQNGELAERIRFTQRAGGAVPSPFDCYLVTRGIKTLPLRMERHCENAQALAEWLHQRPDVVAVHHPGLDSHPQHALAARQMRGFGGMLSFEVERGERAQEVLSRVQLFALAESLGGVESLIGQPARMSHASMPADVREACGIRDGLIRVSVGLEAVEDLKRDLHQALSVP